MRIESETKMSSCLLGLGSNMGERAAQLHRAVKALADEPDMEVRAVSSWHETAPIGGPAGQGSFLNGAVCVESSLPPPRLLQAVQEIERQLGRERHQRWEARPIDVDLLLYDDLVLESDVLRIPHPWMAIRRFVLRPAAEVAAEMVHPIIGWTVGRLLEHISTVLPYVAVAGLPRVGKSRLIQTVLQQLPGQTVEGMDCQHTVVEGVNSAGQSSSTEIQFLRNRAKLLDRRGWSDPHGLRLSDFWLRQSLAYAQLWTTEAEREIVRKAWLKESRRAEPCRLLVLLEAPLNWFNETANQMVKGPPGGPSLEQLARLQLSLQREARQPGQGPVLQLDASNAQRAAADVIAAIRAMG